MAGGEEEAGGDHIPAIRPVVRKGAALVLAAGDLRTPCRNFLPCLVEFQFLGSGLFIYVYFLTNRNFQISFKMDIHHKKKKVDWLVTLDFLSSIQSLLWI